MHTNSTLIQDQLCLNWPRKNLTATTFFSFSSFSFFCQGKKNPVYTTQSTVKKEQTNMANKTIQQYMTFESPVTDELPIMSLVLQFYGTCCVKETANTCPGGGREQPTLVIKQRRMNMQVHPALICQHLVTCRHVTSLRSEFQSVHNRRKIHVWDVIIMFHTKLLFVCVP